MSVYRQTSSIKMLDKIYGSLPPLGTGPGPGVGFGGTGFDVGSGPGLFEHS